MLADDGTVILKFFLHISKKEQKERFKTIEEDPLEAWRVTKADWARHKKYDDYLVATEEMLELTESEYAPWTIVEATSKSHARKKVFETIIARMEKRLGANAPPRTDYSDGVTRTPICAPPWIRSAKEPSNARNPRPDARPGPRILRARDDAPADSTARTRLPGLPAEAARGDRFRRLGCGRQGRRHQAHHREARSARLCRLSHQRAARRGQDAPLPVPLLATAAGARPDRHFRPLVVWPGLVERVEGFATEAEWKRAFKEINSFERQLRDFGVILAKFWIHISREEQFRRFEERKAIGYKEWKLTEEDWRNREKWGAYEEAVEEMLVKTSTALRPGA